MKIAHICTNNAYVDGWGYQDNLLPVYIKELGVDNFVIASNKLPSTYLNGKEYPIGESFVDGIKVIRVKSYLLTNSIVFTNGLYRILKIENPDVIMHHNLNYTSLVICSIYSMIHHKVMVADSHVDANNTRNSKIFKFLYYKVLVGGVMRLFSYPIKKYYGVSLGRCDYLHTVFGVNKKCIDFLPLGVDENKINQIPSKLELRRKYNLDSTKIVIVSGGKMGIDKGTIDLISTIEDIVNNGLKITLLLFGSFSDKTTENLANTKSFVSLQGWCDRIKTLEMLKVADIACWPIHHTTLCEDAIGCGTPLLLRKTRTTEHLIDGNGFFMEKGSKDELFSYLNKFVNLTNQELDNLYMSSQRMKERLSYKTIAKKLIDDCVIE